MTNDNYKVLGLDENCSDEELEAKYKELKAAYSEGRFQEGEAGNEAARKLTELETAYADIIADRKERSFSTGSSAGYYLQSVVFYKKKWSNESKKQLEIAMQMDPGNEKYKNSYDKLVAQISGEQEKNFSAYTSGSGDGAPAPEDRQMGGQGCLDFCCQMALCNMLLNCCCNCR